VPATPEIELNRNGDNAAMDNLEFLRTFVRVVETGSFTAVARETNASLSTISRQITQLEEHFGVRLLNRTTRHLSLTDDGQDLHDHARTVLQMVEGMEAFVGRHKSSPTGHVRIGIPVSLGLLLMDRVPMLIARYPGLSVELVMDEHAGDLIEERLDLAVCGGEVAHPSLIRRGLGPVARIAVAAPAYLERYGSPTRHEDLINHRCIVHRIAAGSAEWELTGPEGPVTVAVRGAVSSNNQEGVRGAAVSGLGIALLPEYLIVDDIRAHILQRVLPEYNAKDPAAFVVYMSRRYMAPRTRIVFDFLIEELHRLRCRRIDGGTPFALMPQNADHRMDNIVAAAA
jgi:DNA-binding transcriptional LysR family regulator